MKITIESTDRLVTVNGVEARMWEGQTEAGIPVIVWIPCIAVRNTEDTTQFEAELLESEEMRDFEGRPLRFVRLTDPSTGRQYTLRVRHDHSRCYEAVGWTFGLTEAEYRNEVQQHS